MAIQRHCVIGVGPCPVPPPQPNPLDQVTLLTLTQAQQQQAMNATTDRNMVANAAAMLQFGIQQTHAATIMSLFRDCGMGDIMAAQQAALAASLKAAQTVPTAAK